MRNRLLLLLLKLALAWHGDQSCSPVECAQGLLGLDALTTYSFNHVINVTTSGSDQDDGVRTGFMSKVKISTGQNACQLQLDVSSEFPGVKILPLRFSMQNGLVDKICANEAETTDSLNFKRGILSTLQTQLEDDGYLEQDVYGKCVTRYTQSGPELFKYKDLKMCASSSSDTLIWKFGKIPTFDAIFEGSMSCVIHDGLEKISCLEKRYLKQPFSDSQKPVFSSEIYTAMMLEWKTTGHKLSKNFAGVFQTIEFAASESTIRVDAYKDAGGALSKICDARQQDSFHKVPGYIRALLDSMEQMNSKDLIKLWNTAPSACREAAETFQQALGWCSTEECIKAGGIMAKNGDMIEEWMYSTAINGPPSEGIVSILLEYTLAETSKNNFATVKLLGSAVGRACNHGLCDKPVVQDAYENLDALAHAACSSDKAADSITDILRGIENAGRITPETFSTCAMNQEISATNFIQIIRAASGASCATLRPLAFDIFTSAERYSIEVRTAAYLNIWNCPTVASIDQIAKFYDVMESLQLKHFVYSHATGLQYSTDPLKAFLKPFVHKLSLEAPHDYQNHQQYSTYWDVAVPIGYHALSAEGYVIYERESPLPRAVHANLTLSFYDEPINLIDMHVRQENLMQMVNKLMHPERENEVGALGEAELGDGIDHANGNYESNYGEPKVDFDIKMLGTSLTTQSFTEDDIRSLLNSATAWDTFKNKLSKFELYNALKSLFGHQKIGVNQDVVLGLLKTKIPNLIGTTTELNLDLIGSTSIKFETTSIDYYAIAGTINPKAVLELSATYTVGLGAKKEQGVTSVINANTATTNAARLVFSNDNYEFRIDTPDEQRIMVVSQKIGLINPEGKIEHVKPSQTLKEYSENFLGHNFFCKEFISPGENHFMRTPYVFELGVKKTDAEMTHFAAQIKKTDTIWSATFGFPNSRENFHSKIWFDADQKVYSIGGIVNALHHHIELDSELNIPRNEIIAKYVQDDVTYRMQGRLEKNLDGSLNTLVVVETPDRRLEFLSRLVNDDYTTSFAFDLQGFKPKIHVDLTFQEEEPQLAMNLQVAEYTFKTEASYNSAPVRNGMNHTINYTVMIPKHQMQGTTEFLNKANEWTLRATLGSDLFPNRKPLILSTFYKHHVYDDRTEFQFAVPIFRIPAIIEISDSSIKAIFDEKKRQYGMQVSSRYHNMVLGGHAEHFQSVVKYHEGKEKKGGMFQYKFLASQFPDLNHSFEYNYLPHFPSDHAGRFQSSMTFKRRNFYDQNNVVSFHQMYNYVRVNDQYKYFLGMNGTFFGKCSKLYADIQDKHHSFTADLRTKFADFEQIEYAESAKLLLSFQKNASAKRLLSVRSELVVPSYMFPAHSRRHMEGKGLATYAKLRVSNPRSTQYVYEAELLLPIEMDNNENFLLVTDGSYSSSDNGLATWHSVKYMNIEVFKVDLRQKSIGVKQKIVGELVYPTWDGQIITSKIKMQVIKQKPSKHEQIDFSVTSLFETNCRALAAAGFGHISFQSVLSTGTEDSFAFESTLKTDKKAQLGVNYDAADSSVSVDFRQTFDEGYVSALSGSGRYDSDDNSVTFNFNRDRYPITVILSFSEDDVVSYRIDIINGDESLIRSDFPTSVVVLVKKQLVPDVLNKYQVNATWTNTRSIGAMYSYAYVLSEDARQYNHFFELENTALSGLPSQAVASFVNEFDRIVDRVSCAALLQVEQSLSLLSKLDITKVEDGLELNYNFENNLFEGPYSANLESFWSPELVNIDLDWQHDYFKREQKGCEVNIELIPNRVKTKYDCDMYSQSFLMEQTYPSGKIQYSTTFNESTILDKFNLAWDNKSTKKIKDALEWTMHGEIIIHPELRYLFNNMEGTTFSNDIVYDTYGDQYSMSLKVRDFDLHLDLDLAVNDTRLEATAFMPSWLIRDEDQVYTLNIYNVSRSSLAFSLKEDATSPIILNYSYKDLNEFNILFESPFYLNGVTLERKATIHPFNEYDRLSLRFDEDDAGVEIEVNCKPSECSKFINMYNSKNTKLYTIWKSHMRLIQQQSDNKRKVQLIAKAQIFYSFMGLHCSHALKTDTLIATIENRLSFTAWRDEDDKQEFLYEQKLKTPLQKSNSGSSELIIRHKNEFADLRKHRHNCYVNLDNFVVKFTNASPFFEIEQDIITTEEYKPMVLSLRAEEDILSLTLRQERDKDSYLTVALTRGDDNIAARLSGAIDMYATLIILGDTDVTVNFVTTPDSDENSVRDMLKSLLSLTDYDVSYIFDTKSHLHAAVIVTYESLKLEFDTDIVYPTSNYLEIRIPYSQNPLFIAELNTMPDTFQNGTPIYQSQVIFNYNDGMELLIEGTITDDRLVSKPFKIQFPHMQLKTDEFHLALKFGESRLGVGTSLDVNAPLHTILEMHIETLPMGGAPVSVILDEVALRLVLGEDYVDILFKLEDHTFNFAAECLSDKSVDKLELKFARRGQQTGSVLADAIKIYDQTIEKVPTESRLALTYNTEFEDELLEYAVEVDLIGGSVIPDNGFSGKTGFVLSKYNSKIFFEQQFDDTVPNKFGIGYRFVPATIQDPMNIDILFSVGETTQKIETEMGLQITTEGAPSASFTFTMEQDVDILKGVKWLPNKVDLANVLKLRSAQISTIWWRNVQNFELINDFSLKQSNKTHEEFTKFIPSIKVATRNDGLEYSVGIDHNTQLMEAAGFEIGQTVAMYKITINREVMKVYDAMVGDETQFENMVKKMTMLFASPVVVPLLPAKWLRTTLFDSEDNLRTRRHARTAEYETEASFSVSTPSDMKTLRLAESFEIRKTNFVSKFDFQNDWDELASYTGKSFRFGTNVNTKRNDVKVMMLLFGQRYILNTRYDGSIFRENDRLVVDLNDIQLEQNFPLFISLGFPSKLNADANCFVQWSPTEKLATCDSAHVEVINDLGGENVEYKLSGSLKHIENEVTMDVYFEHTDEDLDVEQLIHIVSNGTNDISECDDCIYKLQMGINIETAETSFDDLELSSTATAKLLVRNHEDVYQIDASSQRSDGADFGFNMEWSPHKSTLEVNATVNSSRNQLMCSHEKSANNLYAQFECIAYYDHDSAEAIMGYDLRATHGKAFARSVGFTPFAVETKVQYYSDVEHSVHILYHNTLYETAVTSHSTIADIDLKDTLDALNYDDSNIFFYSGVVTPHTLKLASNYHSAALKWSSSPAYLEARLELYDEYLAIYLHPDHSKIKFTGFETAYYLETHDGIRFGSYVEYTGMDYRFHIRFISPRDEMYIKFEDSKQVSELKFHRTGEMEVVLQTTIYNDVHTVKLGLEDNYHLLVQYNGSRAEIEANLDLQTGIDLLANVNGTAYKASLVPKISMEKGLLSAKFEQNFIPEFQLIEAKLVGEVGIFNAQIELNTCIEEQCMTSTIGYAWDDELRFSVYDNTFSPLYDGDEFNAEARVGLRLGSSSSSTLAVFGIANVPTHDIYIKAYIEAMLPILDGSTSLSFVAGLESDTIDTQYGLKATIDMPETLNIILIEDGEENTLLSIELGNVLKRFNFGIAEIITDGNTFKVIHKDSSWVELDAKLKDFGISIKTTISDNYHGIVKPCDVDIQVSMDVEEMGISVKYNDITGILNIYESDGINIVFTRIVPGVDDVPERFESAVKIVTSLNKIGLVGHIEETPFDLSVGWDFVFENKGFIKLLITNTVIPDLPRSAIAELNWDVKSVTDVMIKGAFSTDGEIMYVQVFGKFISAEEFDLGLRHSTGLPIPNFRMEFLKSEQTFGRLELGEYSFRLGYTETSVGVYVALDKFFTSSIHYTASPIYLGVAVNDMRFDFSLQTDVDGEISGNMVQMINHTKYVAEFDGSLDKKHVTFNFNHNATVLYSSYIPEKIVFDGVYKSPSDESDKAVIRINTFQINSQDFYGEVQVSLDPIVVTYDSKVLKIDASFNCPNSYIVIESHGSIPSMAFYSTGEMLSLEIRDENYGVQETRLNYDNHGFEFTNTLLSMLPSAMGMKFNIDYRDASLDVNFEMQDYAFEGMAALGMRPFHFKLAESHHVSGISQENMLNIISDIDNSQPFTITWTASGGSPFEFSVIYKQDDENMIVGFKIDNFEMLHPNLKSGERLLILHYAIKSFPSMESSVALSINGRLINIVSLTIDSDTNIYVNLLTILGDILVRHSDSETFASISTDFISGEFTLLHNTEDANFEVIVKNATGDAIFEVDIDIENKFLKNGRLFILNETRLVELSHRPDFNFNMHYCRRNGYASKCGSTEYDDIVLHTSFNSMLQHEGQYTYHNRDVKLWSINIERLAWNGDQTIHLYFCDALLHASWDLTREGRGYIKLDATTGYGGLHITYSDDYITLYVVDNSNVELFSYIVRYALNLYDGVHINSSHVCTLHKETIARFEHEFYLNVMTKLGNQTVLDFQSKLIADTISWNTTIKFDDDFYFESRRDIMAHLSSHLIRWNRQNGVFTLNVSSAGDYALEIEYPPNLVKKSDFLFGDFFVNILGKLDSYQVEFRFNALNKHILAKYTGQGEILSGEPLFNLLDGLATLYIPKNQLIAEINYDRIPKKTSDLLGSEFGIITLQVLGKPHSSIRCDLSEYLDVNSPNMALDFLIDGVRLQLSLAVKYNFFGVRFESEHGAIFICEAGNQIMDVHNAEVAVRFDINPQFLRFPGSHKVTMRELTNILRVNYPTSGFKDIIIHMENFIPMWQERLVHIYDGSLTISPDNIKGKSQFDISMNRRSTVTTFEASYRKEDDQYEIATSADYDNHVIYDIVSRMKAAEDGRKLDLKTVFRFMDFYSKSIFNYDIVNMDSLSESEFRVKIGFEMEDHFPVHFSVAKVPLADHSRLLDIQLKLGDYSDLIVVNAVSVHVDYTDGQVSVTGIVDDNVVTFGVRDPSGSFTSHSFNSGILLYVEAPDFIDVNSGKLSVGIFMKNDDYIINIAEILELVVHNDLDDFRVKIEIDENKLNLPQGSVAVRWTSDPELIITLDNEYFQNEMSLKYTEHSATLSNKVTSGTVNKHLVVSVNVEDGLLLIVNEDGNEVVNFKFDKESLIKLLEKISGTDYIYKVTNDGNIRKTELGVEYDGQIYSLIGEAVIDDYSLSVVLKARADYVIENVLTLELRINNNNDVEIYIEYHVDIYALLETQPAVFINMLLSFVDPIMNGVDSLNQFIIRNTGARVMDDFLREIYSTVNRLESMMLDIEELNPSARINNKPITLNSIINRGLNTRKEDIDEQLMLLRKLITDTVMEAANSSVDSVASAFPPNELGQRSYKIYRNFFLTLANASNDYLLHCINLFTANSRGFMIVEENKLYITIPMPNLVLPGTSHGLLYDMENVDFKALYYKLSAALGKKIHSREFMEVEAEVVGPYVRQFDGKWVQVLDDTYNAYEALDEKQDLVRVQGDINSTKYQLYLGPRGRNMNFGIFGVPDSEVYSDRLDYLQDTVETLDLDELPSNHSTPELLAYFENSESPARSCFDIISANPYKKMGAASVCTVAAAYKQRCQSFGAFINLPAACY